MYPEVVCFLKGSHCLRTGGLLAFLGHFAVALVTCELRLQYVASA